MCDGDRRDELAALTEIDEAITEAQDRIETARARLLVRFATVNRLRADDPAAAERSPEPRD